MFEWKCVWGGGHKPATCEQGLLPTRHLCKSISFLSLMCLSFCDINQPRCNIQLRPSREPPSRADRVSEIDVENVSLRPNLKASQLWRSLCHICMAQRRIHVYVMVKYLSQTKASCLLWLSSLSGSQNQPGLGRGVNFSDQGCRYIQFLANHLLHCWWISTQIVSSA